MYRTRHDLQKYLNQNTHVVKVQVTQAKGSTPRNAGAWMLVSPSTIFRTIGGGNLEYMAIDTARQLLKSGGMTKDMSLPLGPEIGQCCGGHISLKLQRLGRATQQALIREVDEELAALPEVFVFGAGHVGVALIEALALLPVRAMLVDSRAAELAAAPSGVDTCLTPLPEAIARDAEPGSAFVVLTHDHSLDFLITREALLRGDARYVGMIGSATKKTMFTRWFASQQGGGDHLQTLVCPIGKQPSGDKRPEVIACFVAAEIMGYLAENERADQNVSEMAEGSGQPTPAFDKCIKHAT
jgi:xanthine dehydrogenase accessory factor